jgi:hypothetical protein
MEVTGSETSREAVSDATVVPGNKTLQLGKQKDTKYVKIASPVAVAEFRRAVKKQGLAA